MPKIQRAPSGNTIEARLVFYSRPGKNGCREWVGYLDFRGYGRLQYEGFYQKAHRLAWRFATGLPIPEGMKILHKCDNRSCINPDHLFVGTQTENMADMVRKGRVASKLTAKQVRQIRKAVGTNAKVGQRFGVSPATISRIKRRRGWKHLA